MNAPVTLHGPLESSGQYKIDDRPAPIVQLKECFTGKIVHFLISVYALVQDEVENVW